MLVGMHVPQWGADATRNGVLAVARVADAVGLDSVWVADHVVFPLQGDTKYPYREKGVPFTPEEGFLDALSTLAVIAGATERVRIGTSILVSPMREPLQLAKTAATVDVLSGGRLVLGVGMGWWKEEYEALGVPFEARGKRFEEQLRILRALWRDGRLEHRGDFYDFGAVACEPRPIQSGGPPLLIGGLGEKAQRRAALIGDGWHGVGWKAEVFRQAFENVRRMASDAGRDPDAIKFSTSIGLHPDRDKAIQRLTEMADAGVSLAVLNLSEQTSAATCAAIERLAEEILPAVATVAG